MEKESPTCLATTAYLLGVILLAMCVCCIGFDISDQFSRPERLGRDPVYESAPPDKARSPWR